jgi:hypothetical protein
MKIAILLALSFALPAGLHFPPRPDPRFLNFGWIKAPTLVQEEVDAFDLALKKVASLARAVKNPQIIVSQTGIDKAGNPIHAFSVLPAKIKQRPKPKPYVSRKLLKEAGVAMPISHGFKQPNSKFEERTLKPGTRKFVEKAFKPGYAQVISLDGKKAHYLPIEKIEEGLDSTRLQRLYGFAPRRLTVGEATAISVASAGVVGAGGLAIDAGIKLRQDSMAKSDRKFQIAHGATPENSEIK